MATDIDAIVIGAGVIGLSVARELAMVGLSVVVLESSDAIGTGTSSRNSEVIHAGLYYPQGSLKAKFCIEGRRRLYAFCKSHGVAYRRCGKLIVATTEAEVAFLEGLAAKGKRNGCDDLAIISGDEARRMEPALSCVAALVSPSTGIIDSHGYMLALRGDAEENGAAIALLSPFEQATATGTGFTVSVGGAEPMTLTCSMLINTGGLYASDIARRIGGLSIDFVPATRYAKGNYFMLSGRAPFSRLIYPAPQAHGLGVHLTLDMGGQARFGPDVEWVDTIDYEVDPRRADGFFEAIRRYWPDLPDDGLVPGYSGIRPKIGERSAPAEDFRIDGPEVHGMAGLINLFGIESPGLTSSLAIAADIRSRLGVG
ncbi:NAD(P)/FAD-dependent oxidoreductase [Rhizobium panacihumi]|uniref:NAD(P)/FAD-dependent oxidoreductase n=1 Tax=Rhizobium panacihumi TaxID=2008450 RepID=UPI003D78F22D